MYQKIQNVVAVAVVLGLGTLGAWAGPKVDAEAAKAALKGVVHLSDDDVRFHTKDGRVVFVDPVSGPKAPIVAKAGLGKPDLILVTHPHGDHFQAAVLKEYVALNPAVVLAGPRDVTDKARQEGLSQMKTVEAGQKYEMAGVKFEAVPAYFLEGDSHPKQNGWLGYVLALNGHRYYVTGDTQAIPETANVRVDVAMPLLFGCGGNSANALKIAQSAQATLVVPVHHGDQVEVAKKFVASLPEGVSGAYYIGGGLTVGR